MTFHYEYDEEDGDTAYAIHSLFFLLQKLNVGVNSSVMDARWGGDITLSVEYTPRARSLRFARQGSSDPSSPEDTPQT